MTSPSLFRSLLFHFGRSHLLICIGCIFLALCAYSKYRLTSLLYFIFSACNRCFCKSRKMRQASAYPSYGTSAFYGNHIFLPLIHSHFLIHSSAFQSHSLFIVMCFCFFSIFQNMFLLFLPVSKCDVFKRKKKHFAFLFNSNEKKTFLLFKMQKERNILF